MNDKPRILYAEDDETLAYLTKDNLEQHYQVDHYTDGMICLEAFQPGKYDVCILDVMMPRMDGFVLAQEIRKLDHEIPILFLSAKVLKEDRIKGLRMGADDYLVKPFSMEELVLKIEIFINRSRKKFAVKKILYKLGSFDFHPENFSLRNASGKDILLTQREAALLQYFLDHKNEVLKREQILMTLWGKDDYFLGRSLDVFVSRLRKLLAGDAAIKIENLHGIGFKLTDGST